MGPSWLSVLPPLTIFLIACITRNVVFSFFIGILFASCISNQWNISNSFGSIQNKVIDYITDTDTIFLHLFLLGIGILISFFSLTRARYQEKHTKTKNRLSAQHIEYMAFFLAPLFCIDDYLGILTLGFIMKEMVQNYAISKERLAFMLQSLGAPLVILIPISSWAAAITSQLEQAGVQSTITNTTTVACDPFFLYIQSIPYTFYSFFLLFSILFLIWSQIALERQTDQHFFENKNTHGAHISFEQLRDIFFSVAFLVSSVIIGLLVSGGFPQKSVLEAFRSNTSSFMILFASTWCILIFNILNSFFNRRFFLYEVATIFRHGFILMRQSILIIFFSAIFGQFVRSDLQTGTFLAPFIFGHTATHFLPLMTFLSSLLVTLFIGNGWATFALFIPLIIPVSQSLGTVTQMALLPQLLGALFSGGVCGNQLSPFAETTNMTSYTMHMSPFQHAKTQAIYIIPTLCTTIAMYAFIGTFAFTGYRFFKIVGSGILVSITTSLVIHRLLKRNTNLH